MVSLIAEGAFFAVVNAILAVGFGEGKRGEVPGSIYFANCCSGCLAEEFLCHEELTP